jgi:glycine cleavage system H protein
VLQVPTELKYTDEGIWIKDEGNKLVRLGMTYHFYNVVTFTGIEAWAHIRLPIPGVVVKRGDSFGFLEDFKMLVDFFAPVSGTVVEVNPIFNVDQFYFSDFDMYSNGWFMAVQIDDPVELKLLLSPEGYQATYATKTTTTP